MGRKRNYIVKLTDEQVKEIKKVLSDKATPVTIRSRCHILLDMDENHGKKYLGAQCASHRGVCIGTVTSTVKKFSQGGLEEALTIKRSVNSDNARRKVDGRAESQLIAMACGKAPEGHTRWTLRLLEEKSKVILENPVNHSTIGRVLKKTNFGPTKTTTGVSPKRKTRTS